MSIEGSHEEGFDPQLEALGAQAILHFVVCPVEADCANATAQQRLGDVPCACVVL